MAVLDWWTAIAAIPGSLLLVVLILPIPSRQRLFRKHVTPWVRTLACNQLAWVVAAQRLQNPLLDVLAHASAKSVTVEFYLLVLPVMYFIGLGDVVCQLLAGLACTTYVTCAIKDLICSPRPRYTCNSLAHRRQLQVLEQTSEVEYGAPSMHVSLSLFMCMFAIHVFIEHGALASVAQAVAPGSSTATCMAAAPATASGVYCPATATATTTATATAASSSAAAMPPAASAATAGHLPWLLYGTAVVWSIWIGFSRLYLGVHTPVDLMLGTLTGLTMFGFWRLVGHHFVLWSHGPWRGASVAIQLLLTLCALCAYPCPQHHTTSYQYAVTFLGSWIGYQTSFVDALSGGSGEGVLRPLIVRAGAGGGTAGHAVRALRALPLLAQVVLGLAAALTMRSVSKALLLATLPQLLSMLPLPLRRLLQPPISLTPMHEHFGRSKHTAAHPVFRGCTAAAGAEGEKESMGKPLCDACNCSEGASTNQRQAMQGGDDSAGVANGHLPGKGVPGVRLCGTLGTSDAKQGKADAMPGACSANATAAEPAMLFVSVLQHGSTAAVHDGGKSKSTGQGKHLDRGKGGISLAGTSPDDQDCIADAHRSDGLLLRQDGFPWDADIVRRFLSYGLTVMTVVEYHRLLMAPASADLLDKLQCMS